VAHHSRPRSHVHKVKPPTARLLRGSGVSAQLDNRVLRGLNVSRLAAHLIVSVSPPTATRPEASLGVVGGGYHRQRHPIMAIAVAMVTSSRYPQARGETGGLSTGDGRVWRTLPRIGTLRL
jgi:hypothetical protein